MDINNKHKIAMIGVALISLTAITVTIANTNKVTLPIAGSGATTKTLIFNNTLAENYWSGSHGLKTIPANSEYTSIDICTKPKGKSGHSTLGGDNFVEIEYAINNPGNKQERYFELIAGVNNLQSFSWTFQVNYNSAISETELGYKIVAEFYDKNFDIYRYYYYNDKGSTTLYDTVELASDTLIRNNKYTINWSKTNELLYTTRVVKFTISIEPKRSTISTDNYCTLFVENVTINWNC